VFSIFAGLIEGLIYMSYEIQPNIICENCIKCGKRPVIDQTKKGWQIKCPEKACNNVITGPTIDFDTWNRVNKKNINLPGNDNIMRSA